MKLPAIFLLSGASLLLGVSAPSGLALAQGTSALGVSWDEHESGWPGGPGVWTRRGATNEFDNKWLNGQTGAVGVAGVSRITITGNRVEVVRTWSSDGNLCNYVGTLAADGMSVSGTYTCNRVGGTYNWRAVIRR